jgi:hypothetical protein
MAFLNQESSVGYFKLRQCSFRSPLSSLFVLTLILRVCAQVIKHLKFSGVLIDKQYEQGFQRAILTFLHHRVYDPAKMEMVYLTDVPGELDTDLDFLGPYPFFWSRCFEYCLGNRTLVQCDYMNLQLF